MTVATTINATTHLLDVLAQWRADMVGRPDQEVQAACEAGINHLQHVLAGIASKPEPKEATYKNAADTKKKGKVVKFNPKPPGPGAKRDAQVTHLYNTIYVLSNGHDIRGITIAQVSDLLTSSKKDSKILQVLKDHPKVKLAKPAALVSEVLSDDELLKLKKKARV